MMNLNILKRAALLSLVTLIAGCVSATPYQPAANKGGFSEQKVEDNRYLVSFKGNSRTSQEVVETYLLYRAAEVTLESGHDWFLIADQKDDDVSRHDAAHTVEGQIFSDRSLQDQQATLAEPIRLASAGELPVVKAGLVHKVRRGRGRGFRGRGFRGRGFRGRGFRGRGFRRGGFRKFGFAGSPFFHGGFHAEPLPRDRFEATANIMVFKGEKPADDPRAYDARQVIENLGPRIQRGDQI